VHYPLPLAYVESPEREQLERTIDRLREVRKILEKSGSAQKKETSPFYFGDMLE